MDDPKVGDKYTCAVCGKVDTISRPSEEAWKEFEENFPGGNREDCDLVCDDCYQKMMRSDFTPKVAWKLTELEQAIERLREPGKEGSP